MNKAVIFIIALIFTSCTNEKKRHVDRINQLIGTHFDYKDERISVSQEQDFSSLATEITISLTPLEKQKILSENKNKFKYFETNVDSFTYRFFSYQFENDKIRESI